ncbi:MAG TPA: hypothetical protein VM582_01545, partial [Candidatus Thermoplasmatota archaeon]|nr:hypothetical protein [Candidatus Thermoplasmatota archaeon]
ADVSVIIVRNVQFAGNVQNETITGKTDADGTLTFQPSAAFSVPGTYNVIVRASALGNNGIANARYTVGA